MLKRSRYHDYTSRCFYLITIRSQLRYGPLSEVVGSTTDLRNPPATRLTPHGCIAAEELFAFSKLHPSIEVQRRVFMPDHIHFIIFVKDRIEAPISDFITKYKSACTNRLWDANPLLRTEANPVGYFEPGFNDKIVSRRGQLERFNSYIEDNPRRLLLLRDNPTFFYNTTSVMINGEPHDAYGNLNLLSFPIRSAVIYSSKYTSAQYEALLKEWRETIRQGGVLIGAFIHPEEVRIKNKALEYGGRIIQIRKHGFGEKYKPSGLDFDYCAHGQILQIGYKPYTTRPLPDRRWLFLEMNEFARNLV